MANGVSPWGTRREYPPWLCSVSFLSQFSRFRCRASRSPGQKVAVTAVVMVAATVGALVAVMVVATAEAMVPAGEGPRISAARPAAANISAVHPAAVDTLAAPLAVADISAVLPVAGGISAVISARPGMLQHRAGTRAAQLCVALAMVEIGRISAGTAGSRRLRRTGRARCARCDRSIAPRRERGWIAAPSARCVARR